MDAKEIVKFVKRNIEPIPAISPYGERYRVSATLTDGTHLPCLVIQSSSRQVELALRRFSEAYYAKDPSIGFQSIVKVFVTNGNRLNDYDIKELSPSPWAIPSARLGEIGGETSMSWTEFYATMRDGAEFRFGTTFFVEFFDLPDDYRVTDIESIIPAVRTDAPRQQRIYREKPFFTCYIDSL